MADKPKETERQDHARINIDQDHALSYWSEKFGASRDDCAAPPRRQGRKFATCGSTWSTEAEGTTRQFSHPPETAEAIVATHVDSPHSARPHVRW